MPVIVEDDVNMTFESYYFSLFAAYNVAYPVRENIPSRSKDCEWITPEILRCIKKKSKLYRMYSRGQI